MFKLDIMTIGLLNILSFGLYIVFFFFSFVDFSYFGFSYDFLYYRTHHCKMYATD